MQEIAAAISSSSARSTSGTARIADQHSTS
jgi:hypothetical protein